MSTLDSLKKMDIAAAVAAVIADDPDAAAIADDLALSLEQTKQGNLGEVVELPEELFPAELVDKLLAAANRRLIVWREYRGLSLEELAQECDVPVSFLQDLESGELEEVLGNLRAISRALQVDLELII